MPAAADHAPPLTAAHRRPIAALFAGVALMNTGFAAASAVATLAAADALGTAWSGVPNTAAVIGTAVGAALLGNQMARRSRRYGLMLGYAGSTIGALIAATGMLRGDVTVLVAGMVLLGVGNGGAQLSRYAAADLVPPRRRGLALGTVVWAGTIGGLLGPLVLAPAARLAQHLSAPPLAGAFAVALLTAAAAGLVSAVLPRRPSPTAYTSSPVAGPASNPVPGTGIGRGSATALIGLLRSPVVRVAMSAMATAQVVMVAIMTMTPLFLHQHAHGLHTIGQVLAAHILGMFALSPLSGRLADHHGGTRVITAGLATLTLAATLVIAAGGHTGLLTIAVTLLGYGWNLCFVGGSSLLAGSLPADAATRAEGHVDAVVWATSGVASLGAGALMAVGGYPLVAVLAAALVVLPIITARYQPSPK